MFIYNILKAVFVVVLDSFFVIRLTARDLQPVTGILRVQRKFSVGLQSHKIIVMFYKTYFVRSSILYLQGLK